MKIHRCCRRGSGTGPTHCLRLIGSEQSCLIGYAGTCLQEGFVAEDDFGASADYTRENDDEAAAIAERKRWDEKNAALQTAQVFHQLCKS